MKINLFCFITVIFLNSIPSYTHYIPPASLFCHSVYIADVWCNDVDSDYVYAKGRTDTEGEKFFFVSAKSTWGQVGYPHRNWHVDFKYMNSDGTKTVWLSTFDGRVQPLNVPFSKWTTDGCVEANDGADNETDERCNVRDSSSCNERSGCVVGY